MLGSGLGALADGLEDRVDIAYRSSPASAPAVAGHAGTLVLGGSAAADVAIFAGRSHVYERIDAGAITTPVRTLKRSAPSSCC